MFEPPEGTGRSSVSSVRSTTRNAALSTTSAVRWATVASSDVATGQAAASVWADRIHKPWVERDWHVNPQRLHRLCKRERLRPGAERINHVWSYDFVADRTEDGQQITFHQVLD